MDKPYSMRRLKIMMDDYNPPVDPFGTDRMADALKAFCREQGMDAPEFWIINPDRYIDPEGGSLMPYAAVLHLSGKDRWEEFEACAIFLLTDFSERENREMERSKLEIAFRDLGDPVVLTTRMPEGLSRQRNNLNFYRSVGMTRMPITWEDEAQHEYEVYVKGHIDMGPFANLMERMEYIGRGSHAVYSSFCVSDR